MRTIWCTIAMACTIAAVPARAADPTTLPCIEAAAGEEGRAQIGLLFRSFMGAGDEGKETGQFALAVAMARCAVQHGWSDAARTDAGTYMTIRLGWPIAAELAAASHLDLPAVERMFDSLSPRDKQAMVQRGAGGGYSMGGVMYDKLVKRLTDAGAVEASNAKLARRLLAMLAMRERALHDFTVR